MEETSLIKVTEAQKTFAALRMKGEMIKTCAEVLSVSPATLYRWQKADWYENECSIQRRKFIGDPIATFTPMYEAALDVYEVALKGRGKKLPLAFKAATSVIDRLQGMPIRRQQTEVVADVNINVVTSGGEATQEYVDAGFRVIDLQAPLED